MSKKQQRIKRPDLKRAEPIRSWSAMMGAAPSASAANGQSHGHGHGHSHGNGKAAGEGGGEDKAADPAAWGARLGYKVIDEYLRRGEEAAREVWSPAGVPGAARDPRQLAGRMLQYATDLSSGWVDLVTAVMMNGNTPPAPAGFPPIDFGIGPNPPTNGHDKPTRAPAPARTPASEGQGSGVRLSLAIDSSRPVEISVALDSPRPGAQLTVHALRATGARKARFAGVVLERQTGATVGAQEAFTVKVKIPPKQPAGTYRGAIVEEGTSLSCGTVTVTVA